MVRKVTTEYVDELLQIYKEICELSESNCEMLFNLKAKFYDYYKSLDKYNMMHMYLTSEVEWFLKEYNIYDFKDVHRTLEGIVFLNFWTSIVPCLLLTDKDKENFYNSIYLNRLEFAKKYEEVYNFGIKEENRNLTIDLNKMNILKFSEEEIALDISKFKKRINDLREVRKTNRRLLKDEIIHIENCLIPYFNFYKQFIEKNFFEIKELFPYYNVELRVFIGMPFSTWEENDEIYEMRVYVYPNDSNELYIYPAILDYFPSFNLDIEETDKEATIKKSTFINFKNKSESVFEISTEKIYGELLNLFWNISDEDSKDKFLVNLFSLCGFINAGKEGEIYKVNKYDFDLAEKRMKKSVDEIYIVIPNNILYIDDNYAEKLVKKVNDYRINNSIDNIFYCLCNVDTFRRKVLATNNISCLSLNDIIRFLISSNGINLFANEIMQYVLMCNKDDLKKQNNLKIKGEDLLKKLDNINVGKDYFKEFENIMCDIFNYLFIDSFDYYYSEKQSQEYEGHRIRDLVIANTTPRNDFWKQRKIEQNSKRIIVDFKNYSKVITQATIHDVSKYLNNKKGNFAIVVSASGIDKSGIKEQQLKYFDDNKLIIHLDKIDVAEMIYNKMNNINVETLLEKKLIEISIK